MPTLPVAFHHVLQTDHQHLWPSLAWMVLSWPRFKPWSTEPPPRCKVPLPFTKHSSYGVPLPRQPPLLPGRCTAHPAHPHHPLLSSQLNGMPSLPTLTVTNYFSVFSASTQSFSSPPNFLKIPLKRSYFWSLCSCCWAAEEKLGEDVKMCHLGPLRFQSGISWC